MRVSTSKISHKARTAFPTLFPTTLINTHWLKHNDFVQEYNASHPRFASLATKSTLQKMKSNLIEIDIKDEISLLTDKRMLEITVPVCGINDFLGSDFGTNSLNFPCVLALNGFGAKESDEQNQNFPRADYVRMTDIVGNQFEIVVNQDGKIELPENGIGLFSIPQSLTFIYNSSQILEGFGLKEVTSVGISKNKIYLLPPTKSLDSFSPYICVSHLNENNSRIVDSIRRVYVKFDDLPLTLVEQNSNAKHYEDDNAELLYIDILLSTSHKELGGAFNLSVSLEPLKGVGYSFNHLMKSALPTESHGWKQHPILSNVYTKHFGLSQTALKQLIHRLYSESDFMQDYLQGDLFNLSIKNGYNQFLIHPEALSKCYDLFVYDLVCRKIPGSFLIDRIADERLIDLDLSGFTVDFHDSIVLEDLKASLATFHFDALNNLFFDEKIAGNEFEISEYFYVYALGIQEKLPQVTVKVTQGKLFSKNLIAAFEANFQDNLQDNERQKTHHEEREANNGPLVFPDRIQRGFSNAAAYENNENKSDDNEAKNRLMHSHERRNYTPSFAVEPDNTEKDMTKKSKKLKPKSSKSMMSKKNPLDQDLKRPPPR